MYEQHFGLKKKPFCEIATGNDVFVGPQTATAMASLKKALASRDTIVAISGAAGSGKTTLVGKALLGIGKNQIIIRIRRMRLDIDDVLDLLLEELAVPAVPKGTLQRFATFRQTLADLEATDARIFIVVEDVARLGAETLAELEALTASDAGPSSGANIILMGDEQLNELLRAPQLARLAQRIRQRLTIAPLPAAELRGYLRHCFRLAGGDYEKIFEGNSADLVHHLSGGIPRIANNLAESAMKAAADANEDMVQFGVLSKVANDEFGLSSEDFVAAPAAVVELKPVAEPKPMAEPEPISEPKAVSEPEPVTKEPVIVFSDSTDEALDESLNESEFPDLIDDTQPELAILSPVVAPVEDIPELVAALEKPADQVEEIPKLVAKLATPAEPAKGLPEPSAEPTIPAKPTKEIPELSAKLATSAEPADAQPIPEDTAPNTQTAETPGFAPERESGLATIMELQLEATTIGPANDIVSESDGDPIHAKLKPDVDALEEAMAPIEVSEPETPSAISEPEHKPVETADAPDAIPEITLDNAIGEANEAEAVPVEAKKKPHPELNKIAQELAKAKSLEDIDDKMAETLFGAELDMIAAQIIANPPSAEPANDEHEPAAVDVKVEVEAPKVAAANGNAAADLAMEAPAVAPAVPPPAVTAATAVPTTPKVGMDLGATQQRLNMVRQMNDNAAVAPATPTPQNTATPKLQPLADEVPVEAPEPIENQINTSITQTLKALKMKDVVAAAETAEAEAEVPEKKGFFSRFKRS